MSFETGLSGLLGASQSLDVIGNNIANANTTGMKSSTVDFSNLVAASLGAGGASNAAGIGVTVAEVAQNFTQGNINVTNNNLDVAINGNGFFTVKQASGNTAYTRDGSFQLDKNGYLITTTGSNVMGYASTTPGGALDKSTLVPLQLPTTAPVAASATQNITAAFNLDASAPVATTTTSPTQYATSLTVYDSQGNPITQNFFFVKSAADTWDAYTTAAAATTAVQTSTPAGVFQMAFNTSGTLASVTPSPATVTVTSPNTNIGTFSVAVDVSSVTQYGTNFGVSSLSQDGYTSGDLTSVSIDPSGNITSHYSNGQTQSNDQIQLTTFRNVQGLEPLSGGEFLQTYASGAPITSAPNVGNVGALQAGALEQSNVDLTSELVNMMTAQRDYQANAQTIKTQDQVMSTLVNLR